MPRPRFKKLSTQIYLTILAALFAVVIAGGTMWRRAVDNVPMRQALEVAGELLEGALPPPEASRTATEEALKRISARLKLDLALFDASRSPIATSGRALPSPPRSRSDSGVILGRGGPAWAVPLPDGRWLVVRNPLRAARHPALWFLGFLAAIAAAVGLTAWPVVRGLTRRLERLQQGVERLGAGNLGARVVVEGRDEVARLARDFNTSAERIERLVQSHRLLLANASHELRTPLARVRMGVELLKEKADPERKAALERDIAELDRLIDEILLSSRLGAGMPSDIREHVDLLALAAEEAAHYDATEVSGMSADVVGDPQLLRRLVRNLLENAHRHGRPPVDVTVKKIGAKVTLRVSDQGPGFAPAETERAFEAFHRGPDRGRTPGSGLGLALVRQIAERHGGAARIVAGDDGTTLNAIEIELPGA
ncbi:MAG: HAMP domain-containing histidine kinase [Hyphomicrobiaceae bacterium]|nr:HAMP domain-containing histidine kinase [Hyphomicrobiaceae bacterium]